MTGDAETSDVYPLQRFGGRKFVSTMSSIVSATVLVACGLIEGGVYSAVMIATAAAYIAGNVSQKVLS